METLQSTIFIEFDVNTKKITFLRGDGIVDYDSNVTNVYVRVKYKNLSGNTVYLTPSELEGYKFSLYTMKPATNNVNVITGEVTDELKENVYGGVVKFEIPRVCTNRLGIVKCEIHINQENKIIASSRFVLDVKQSLVTEFDDTLLGDEDFPVLKQLILEIQKASNIDDNNISKITTYSSNKIEDIKEDLDSQIKEKVNRGEGGVITNAMLSQEVKEAMTGGSVAVVGRNTVLEENIVDGQVTKRKTSFYKKSINLENRDLFVAGKGILSNNGELYDNSDLSAFEEYVPIDCDYISYERFTLNGISDDPDSSKIGVSFYDTNKAWISFSDIRSREYIQVPSGAKYIRLHIPTTRLVNSNINVLPKKEITGTYLKQYEFEEMSGINKEIAQSKSEINEKMEQLISGINEEMDQLMSEINNEMSGINNEITEINDEMSGINNEITQLKDGTSIKDGVIKPSKTTFFNIYKNLFDVSKIVVGAILKEAGVLATEFDQWKATDWIEVKGGTTVYFSKDGEPYAIHLGALYDTNKNYLSGMNDTNSAKVSQDGYIRVSQNGGFPDKFQIEVGQVTKYKEFGIEEFVLKQEYLGNIMDNIGNKYEGKNYLLLGDSITALGNNPYGWEYHFRNIMKPNKVVNISVNGCSWKDKVDTPAYDGNPTPENNLNVIGNQVQKVINQKAAGNVDYDNFDVIIIACGTNDDYDLNNPETDESIEAEFVTAYGAGNFAVKPLENVNRKTFAGIMRYTYEKLYELYPNAVFFVTTPLQEVYESYKSIKAKGDLIDAVADRLSINTINTRRCGILNLYESPVGDIDYDNPTGSESSRKRDLSDGIHTNESGGKKLGEFIARDIINYFNF